jgi:hypothetical protein
MKQGFILLFSPFLFQSSAGRRAPVRVPGPQAPGHVLHVLCFSARSRPAVRFIQPQDRRHIPQSFLEGRNPSPVPYDGVLTRIVSG